MKHEIIITKDGSHTIFVPELNERYHSIHGAIQESEHVFIKSGLHHFLEKNKKNDVSIFEVGLGTGLNCLLTFIEGEKLNQKINYYSIEAFPLDIEKINQLNYIELINNSTGIDLNIAFQSIHKSKWNETINLSPNFIFHKIYDTVQNIRLKNNFDIIYFDAFAPTVQPELWTEEIFIKLYNCLNNDGILVTYCAKGEVKRTLKKAGFTVESIQGPPGKREMIRAIKGYEYGIEKI